MSLITISPTTTDPEGAGGCPTPSTANFESVTERTNLTFAEATELLDVLERRGVEGTEVQIGESGLFTVRWAA